MTPTSARSGFVWIAGGTAVGQVVALACIPLISRVFLPAEFGAFAVLLALTSIIGVAAAWRLDLAVPLPSDAMDAQRVAVLGIAASLATGTAMAVGTALLVLLDVDTPVGWWILAAGPISSLYGVFLVLNQVALRDMRFRSVGLRNAIQIVSGVVAQLTFGVMGWGLAGLVLGYSLGHVLGILLLIRGLAWPVAPLSGSVLRRFRSFPMFLAPSAVINASGIFVPAVLIAAFYGAEAAGLFALAQRLLAAPVTFVGTAVSQVLIAKLGADIRAGAHGAPRMIGRVSRFLALGSLALMASAITAGIWIVEPLLGPDWTGSGALVIAMAPMVAAQLCVSPVSVVLILLERTKTMLAWDVLRVISVGTAVVSAHHFGFELHVAVYMLSAASVLAYLVMWGLCRQALPVDGTGRPAP